MAETENIKIKLVQSATGCTMEEAELAWAASDGDEKKAVQMVDLIRPRYIALKMHFSGSGVKSVEGLVVVLIEEDADAPLYTTCVVVNYSDDPLQIDTTANAVYWQQLVTNMRSEQNKFNMESSIELQDYIKGQISPEPLHTLFKTSREMKELDESEEAESVKSGKRRDELKKLLQTTMTSFLEGSLAQPLKVDVGIDLYNQPRFEDIAESLGIAVKKDEEDENEKVVEEEKPLFVHIKGKVVIDVTEGIIVADLKANDKIAVDIIERSTVAENLGRLLGLKNQGHWLHAWGIIREIEEVDDRRHFAVEIARNIFVDTVTMNNVRVKSNRKYPGGSRKQYVLESPSSIPAFVMVAGIALFFSLLVKIFMVVANR